MGPHDPITLLPAGRPDDPRPSVADTMAAKAVRDAPAKTTLARRRDFEARHPQVKIIPSGQNPDGLWVADWPGRGDDEHAGHDTCAGLLDYLEARFDRGDKCGEAAN
jgi:hypothetical protein